MARRMMIITAVAAVAPLMTAGTVAQPEVNEQDRTFLVQAHQGNLTEIEAGHAAGKATTKKVRDIGALLVQDHTQLDRAVQRQADKAGVELPDEPSAQQRATLAKVTAKSGEAFNQAWLASQATGHRQTLEAIKKQLRDGASPDVKELASDAQPVVQRHLDLLLGTDQAQ